MPSCGGWVAGGGGCTEEKGCTASCFCVIENMVCASVRSLHKALNQCDDSGTFWRIINGQGSNFTGVRFSVTNSTLSQVAPFLKLKAYVLRQLKINLLGQPTATVGDSRQNRKLLTCFHASSGDKLLCHFHQQQP